MYIYFNIKQARERRINYRRNRRRHGREKIRNGNQTAHDMCPELMEKEIPSNPFQDGSDQLSGCGCCSSGI